MRWQNGWRAGVTIGGRLIERTGSRSATGAVSAWIGTIGLLALALRLSLATAYAAHPIGRVPWVDEGAYGARAQAILDGAWLPEVPFFQDPLYPYLLAGVMAFVGTSIGALRIAFGVLGTLTPLVVFVAARRGFGLAEAVVAGILTTVYGPLIFADVSLGKEGPAALGASVALAAAAGMCGVARQRRAAVLAGLAGGSWGLVALLRSNALLLAPLGAILCAREGAGRRWLALVAYGSGFALAVVPAVAVNRVVSQPPEWIVTTWQAGPNFYIGNNPQATGTYAAPSFVEPNPAREAEDFASEARRRTGRPLTYGNISQYWWHEGLRWWREAPWGAIQLLAKKVGLVVHAAEIPDNQDPALVWIVADPLLGWGGIGFGILGPLAALGVPAAWRSTFGRWVVVTSAAGLASTAVFFVVGRYRIPWVPGLALLGGAGVVELGRLVLCRNVRAIVLRFALIAVPFSALAWRPIADPAPERWGHSLISLALAEINEWHFDAAVDTLDEARALGGGAAARIEQLLAEGPVHGRMATMVDTRVRTPLPGLRTDLRLARELRQIPEGRSESRRLLDKLARQNPDDPAVLRESAAWRFAATDDPGARSLAIEELSRALRHSRPDPKAAILLTLATFDPSPLIAFNPERSDPLSTRARLARAILANPRHEADRNRESPSPK